MPVLKAETGLQRTVTRIEIALDLIDHGVVCKRGVWFVIRPGADVSAATLRCLIDVKDSREVSSESAYIPDLCHHRRRKAVLHIQVEAIRHGGPEVLVYGEQVHGSCARECVAEGG